MELIHGGDVTGFERRYGRKPLDFSASLNPLGMPPAVAESARRAVGEATAYPDPLCRDLAAALAGRLGVSENNLVFGNGAADVIHRLVLAARPRVALMAAPTFAEYGRALEAIGCGVVRHTLSDAADFRLGEDFVEAITPGIDLVFLCQPNNPTGRPVEPVVLAAILSRCAAVGALLFADECFCPFLDDPVAHSLMGEIASRANLFILGSFTKLYAMAGLRLGFGVCGDAALAERVRSAGQPWAVSSIAQAAGLAALGETDFVERSLSQLSREREWLVREVRALGMRVSGSRANYVFFDAGVPDLDARLAARGILIRNCGNFPGLRAGYFRVGVRTREDNEILIAALRESVEVP